MSPEPTLRSFKAVLFDVDGTLVDSLAKLVNGLGDAIERISGNRPPDGQIRSLVGMSLRAQLPRYFPKPPTELELEQAIAHTIERYEFHSALETPFDAAVEALRTCHDAGLKTALVTSKNAQEMAAFDTKFSGMPYVDATVCASDVLNPKPHPESAFEACRLLGVKPEEAVLVGDSIYDMRCAREAGVTPVAVAYGSSSKEALLAELPALVLDSPEALLDWTQNSLLETPCAARTI